MYEQFVDGFKWLKILFTFFSLLPFNHHHCNQFQFHSSYPLLGTGAGEDGANTNP
jgi:hypothetical protein